MKFQTPWSAVGSTLDKPMLAIGPAPGGGTPSRHYLTFSRVHHNIWAAYSESPTNGLPWTERRVYPNADPLGPNSPHYRGWGTMGTVLDSGRIVVVAAGDVAPYNGELPVVMYSEDAESSIWWPDEAPPVPVAEGAGIEATTIRAPENEPGDTPYQIDGRLCAPSIARDPASNDVYVAFYARRAPGSTNTDIYISRSDDGGQSFPNGPPYLLQLDDASLGIDPNTITDQGPDQVMPAIAVDSCGGVNVFFYDNRFDPDLSDDEHWLDVWFVRITNFTDPANRSIFQARLTCSSTVPCPPGQTAGFLLTSLLGHYHHMAVGGPKPALYPAYIAIAKDASGQWTEKNCYTHQIKIICLSDLNANGESDPEDVTLFTTAFDAGTSDSFGGGGGDADPAQMADLNGDGVVDLDDYDLFWDQYLNGCNED